MVNEEKFMSNNLYAVSGSKIFAIIRDDHELDLESYLYTYSLFILFIFI